MLTSVDKIGIWILTGFLAIFTIFTNVYILLINQRNFRQNNLQLSPGDTIITGISVASIGHQVFAYLWMTMIQVDINCMYESVESTLLVLVFSLKFSILWTTAFLTFFYSTKLVIKPIQCYTCIQGVILKHVWTVLIVIFVCGFINCLPFLSIMEFHEHDTKTVDCGSNLPEGSVGLGYIIYIVVIADVIPGILMIKSSISISYHLFIHLRNMKESTNGSHAPKLGTQMRVIRMNLTLVAVFLCFLVVDLYTQATVGLKSDNSMGLSILFSTLYTTVSGFVLIYGKKSFWKEFLHWYNLYLDEYPCLGCMKVPESKTVTPTAPKH